MVMVVGFLPKARADLAADAAGAGLDGSHFGTAL
jgi:hypothetical protein